MELLQGVVFCKGGLLQGVVFCKGWSFARGGLLQGVESFAID